jgi:hypothetical protein
MAAAIVPKFDHHGKAKSNRCALSLGVSLTQFRPIFLSTTFRPGVGAGGAGQPPAFRRPCHRVTTLSTFFKIPTNKHQQVALLLCGVAALRSRLDHLFWPLGSALPGRGDVDFT